MTAAAFKATYADWKVIKGRKVVQVVFELPLEASDEAYQVLGGMPIGAHEAWCAIARLKSETKDTRPDQSVGVPAGDKPPKSPAQIAGYLCTLGSFQEFLRERFTNEWCGNASSGLTKEQTAKETLYDICAVTSRTQLTKDNTEWHALQLAFRLWENHPELEDA